MARKRSQNKGTIKYLLFTVVVLLVTVSLLSLFVFKYTNLASDSVLGAYTGPGPSAVTCENCAQFAKGSVAIVLQRNGTDPKKWGAMCVTQAMLNTVKHLARINCPTPSPKPTCTPRPTCAPESGTACPKYEGKNICPPTTRPSPKPTLNLTPRLSPTPNPGQTSL